ncbi:exonuclease domain-containing protein [Bacteriovorax sp. PP10]|uniref:Exonuclease domain-containing protein n=1 Tax=Bacteriovorax antarcticus TaxID=3088717 RepID=A0ABU5VYN1_9BACT|nr:exonuclease domain-containing protein [Bacteriovorax sp. PP10]MEA9358183.1 exonuclease domain-containing protein [Bacteriovorax sp. PP10]
MPIKPNTKYSVIDLETTGSNAFGQKIIEIGIINYDGEKIEEVYSTLINPEKYISHGITMITGITNEMIADAPKFYEVAKKIVEMTEGRVFVAHNVFFDYRFLQREFQELGYVYKRDVFCTCKTSRSVFPGLSSYSLQNLCTEFSIPRKAAHRALSDAEDALELFKMISSKSEIKTLREEMDHLIPAQLKDFDFENFPETPGLYFMYDKDSALLYVGKSKNIRGRLKQHFKQFQGMMREQQLKSRVERVEYLECFHDLPTTLLELHYIKTMRPYFNRVGTRKNFRYGIILNHPSKCHAPGDEIKITKSVEDVPLVYSYGSKRGAIRAKEMIYAKVFGLVFTDLNFADQINNYKRVLGEDLFYKKISDHYEEKLQVLPDTIFEKRNWSLMIEDNSLKSIWVKNVGVVTIEETPDMRALLLPLLKKTFKKLHISSQVEMMHAEIH